MIDEYRTRASLLFVVFAISEATGNRFEVRGSGYSHLVCAGPPAGQAGKEVFSTLAAPSELAARQTLPPFAEPVRHAVWRACVGSSLTFNGGSDIRRYPVKGLDKEVWLMYTVIVFKHLLK